MQGRYRQIFKATSVFGIVQIANVVITIVRGKVLSVLLGSTGMGINGLLLAATTFVKNLTSLGLPESAVRQIAIANGNSDKTQIRRTVSVFYKWIWLTVALGVAVMILFSPLLSKITFDSSSHWNQFAWLSITIFFGALTSATQSVMRGMQRLRYLAISSVLGSLLGLAVGIPIIFLYGIDGIVPSIIITSIASYLLSLHFKNRIQIEKISIPWRLALEEGKDMIKLGIVLSFTVLLTTAINFIMPAYIASRGTVGDAGLYTTGVSLTSGYIGMVFSAMITDYFPKLSAAVNDNSDWQQLVTQQAELVLLILAPVLILLITTGPIVIQLLLTSEFLPILEYIPWAALGLFIQGITWALAAIIVAKGDFRIKLYSEVVSQIFFVGASMVGYTYYGLQGLGIGFLTSRLFSFVMILVVSKNCYQFFLSIDLFKVFFTLMLGCLFASLGAIYLKYPTTYYSGTVIFIVISSYSIYHLNKRLDFRELALMAINKFKR